MRAIIFNYNMPEASSIIYNKLLIDGFDESEILLVDNGSEKVLKPSQANFTLPWNVRFTGQAFMALTYLLNFFDDNEFLLISTSARLQNEFNYKKCFERAREKAGNEFGFITSGLVGGLTLKNAPGQTFDVERIKLERLYLYQPIAILVTRRLLNICKKYSAAYFNLELKRGWGIDRELQFMADLHNIDCFVDRSFSVEWVTNSTHNSGRADETADEYWHNAANEMNGFFCKKYSFQWEEIFKKAFNKELVIDQSGNITSVAP